MSEQPPKFICELCGGSHPTDVHIAVSETGKEKEQTREVEPNHEAMEKVVDLFTAEDLKYRNDPILPTLETDVPTPLTGFLYEPFGRVDERTREEIKKMKLAREEERMSGRSALQKAWSVTGFRQSANVFYPEGLLKYLKDRVLHTKTIEPWSEKHAIAGDIGEGQLGDWGTDYNVTNKLGAIFGKLKKDQQEQIARLVGLSSKEIENTLGGEYPRLNLDKPKNEREKQVRVILESFFLNAETYELLRRIWLKHFFDSGNAEKTYGLQSYNYNLKVGLVLSPDTKVAVSPHDDYPTQATILSPRVKPKDIIGIFVNSEHAETQSLYGDEAIVHHPYGKETPLQQLEKSFFYIPQHPIEYLFARYARPFIIFLEESGFDKDKIKPYFSEYKGTYRDQRTKQAKETTEKIRGALNEEEFSRIEMLAKKFIEEKSPVKSGEILWTGLTHLAERHQLPIYNTRGELLWPKRMKHEEVARFVAQKENGLKDNDSSPAPPVPSEQAGKKEGG